MSAAMLTELGATSEQVAAFAALDRPALVGGRVFSQRGPELRVRTGESALVARASGALAHAARAAHELPVVGDFVAVRPGTGDGSSRVEFVLPRSSLLRRREAGTEGRVQAMAANVDVVFAVAALEQGFSPRRIERVVALSREAPANAVVVLTKADLCDDVPAAVRRARDAAPGAAVVVLGANDEGGLADLAACLPARRTGVLVGLSGAGKSTLINRLLAGEHMAVGAVRAFDARGRHTTTHRELIAMPWGGFLVDGPGVRELGVVTSDGLGDAFDDVHVLAARCRFSDCTHAAEPGCAVREAVEQGRLARERLDAYAKLKLEAAFGRAQVDAHERRARKRRERALTNAAWQAARKKRDPSAR